MQIRGLRERNIVYELSEFSMITYGGLLIKNLSYIKGF